MSTITERIQELSKVQLIEAATFVSNIILNKEKTQPFSSEIMDEVVQDPYSHIDDIENLSRMILFNAAASEEYISIVEDAVKSVGSKNLILGGAEIVALAALGVAALKIIINPKKKESIEYYDENRKKVKHNIEYQNSTDFLKDIFKSIFGGHK